MFINSWLSAVIFLAISAHSVDYEGQPCFHVTKNLTGTCTLLINCESAVEEVQSQVLPQICGLGATAPIVCCPKVEVGDKARAKCLQYSKLRKGKCNIQFDRSANLTDAVGKEFPHVAILGYSGPDFTGRRFICGGTLISERFVLTAAHCASTRQYEQPKYVRLGDLHLQKDEDDAEPQEFKIEEVIIHPGYNPPRKYNDIALIKLNRDVEFTPYVFPTCLHAKRDLDASGQFLNAGWSKATFDSSDLSQQMRRILLKITDFEQCKKMYPTNRNLPEGIVDEMMICAGPEYPSCYGVSGSSLQSVRRDVDCMYDMVGVLTFGKICGFDTFPDVFVRISHYIEWIEKVVWP